MFSILLASFLEKFIEWDQWLFIQINSKMTNAVFDVVMPFARNGTHWAPVYLFLAAFVLINFRMKGLWWLLLFLATASLTDMTGTFVFKDHVSRFRPCADPEFYMQVRLLLGTCGGGSSFVSNHAANHFGMAAFFFLTFRPVLKSWRWIAFCWAALIAYAQVYVGLHYPADVLAGALLGLLIGTVTGKLFIKRFGFSIFE